MSLPKSSSGPLQHSTNNWVGRCGDRGVNCLQHRVQDHRWGMNLWTEDEPTGAVTCSHAVLCLSASTPELLTKAFTEI